MPEPAALFNVDTQQPREEGTGLAFRPRIQPMAALFGQLLELSQQRAVLLVSTACVNAGPIEPALDDDVLFIGIDMPEQLWKTRVAQYRRFFLEKRGCGSREANLRQRAYDVFHANPNAARLVRALDVPHWVVFGDSGAYCLYTTALGLLRLGCRVTVLVDAVAPGAATEAECGEALKRLGEFGATLSTADEFLRSWS